MTDLDFLMQSVEAVIEKTAKGMGLSWVSEIAKKMFRNYASKYKWFLDGLMNEKGEVDIDLVDETIKGFFKSRGGSIELLGFELNEKIATQLKNEFIGLKTRSKI